MDPKEARILALESELKKVTQKLNGFIDLIQKINLIDRFYLTKPLVLRNTKIIIEGEDGLMIGTEPTDKLAFFGETPVAQQTAQTAGLTAITHTAPGTPDYAIQDLVSVTPFGFVTKDEGNTVLSVIKNLQTRVTELETKLNALGFLA